MKPNSAVLRDKLIEKKILEKTTTDDEKDALRLSNMRKREDTTRAHRKIKFARKKLNSEGTKKLTVPAQDGSGLQEITDKETIEKVLMQINKSKFQEANATPFMQDPLRLIIEPRGTTQAAEEILLGTFPFPPDLDQATIEFLEELKMPECVLDSGPIETDIFVEEHVQYWKRARESIQSSMSGMHFGFYKATASSPSLAQTVVNLVRIPLKGGFATTRQSKSLNVSLQ